MATTKSDVLDEFIRSKVREGMRELAANCVRANPQLAQTLMGEMERLAATVGYSIARNAYGRMELEDILRWKIRRPHWE